MSSDFSGQVMPIPEPVRERMHGLSWMDHPQCPPFEDLALIHVDYWSFDAAVHEGEMVTAASVADDLVRVFEQIFDAGFPIGQMVRIDAYDADDFKSMAANNSSCFCFRQTPRGTLSQHALGLAVDINPVQNPMLLEGEIHPPAGHAYLDRTDVRAGMLVRPSPVIDAFEAIGWQWGGDWESPRDYHHFQQHRKTTAPE